MTAPAFAVDSITQEFGVRRVLSGIHMTADHGEIIGILGPNGVGKSTLFRCIAAMQGHNPGVCRIEGHYTPPERRWTSVGYLPQDSLLPRSLSVGRAIRQFLPGKEARKSVADDERVHSILGQRVASLSGGERRYLEFLMVLSLRRLVTLLDEPFSGLEPISVERMQRLMRMYCSAFGCVVITDQNTIAVRQVAARVVELVDGRLAAGDQRP